MKRLALLAPAAVIAAAWWWRKNPSACPYSQRFWVDAPHPLITRERLREVLAPQPGERILEIGPGTGYYTLDMAGWVGDGTIEIFDLQQEFLDHTMERAGERGIENVVPTQGDATKLPYADDSIDAVVLVAVLGEIPEQQQAMREIARVLKAGGRLVVGELIGDPHFTTVGARRSGEARWGCGSSNAQDRASATSRGSKRSPRRGNSGNDSGRLSCFGVVLQQQDRTAS